ncbi:MAG TPA: PHB depolymerase family esterase [Pirellulales bacterium]
MLPWLLLSAFLSADPQSAQTLSPGDRAIVLTVDGMERSYLVHVPKSPRPAEGWPVVLVLHGGMGNSEITMKMYGMNDKADASGFLAVYPDGTGRLGRAYTWNAGDCCGYAARQEIDDVTFVKALLDDLAKRDSIDARRVFATGMSNGGMMCYRLASELSDRIAAIAPVSGGMGQESCKPTRPVSVMHFHGTKDENYPLAGGIGDRSVAGVDFRPVSHGIKQWIAADGCPSEPKKTELPNLKDDGTHVTQEVYGPGRDGSEVVLVTIHGGAHTWPGRAPRREGLGLSTQDVSANDMMWEFFQRHPMPEKASAR